MSALIEDYGLIGDLQTAALVSRHGCVDWLCVPRFDSGAVFAALLGDADNGHWTIQPEGELRSTGRRYRGDTLVLETELETEEGAVRLIDFMPPRETKPDLVRIVEGLRGRVQMRMELVLRFDYGSIVPWVRTVDGTLVAIAGPDAVALHTPVELEGRNLRTFASFSVAAGERVPFVLTWCPSNEPIPDAIDPEAALADTVSFWDEWAATCRFRGRWEEAVHRSLLTLKAMIYAPTGGIVAAPTTSLPEAIGGVRNWDYRYCWLRDATLTLLALLRAGYNDEAHAWRDWLLRAIAGSPEDIQIMYGVAGRAAPARGRARRGSRATRALGPCASATARRASCSSTCTGRSSARCTRRVSGASRRPTTRGRWPGRRSTGSSPAGDRRTRGSGRSVGRGATSPTRR